MASPPSGLPAACHVLTCTGNTLPPSWNSRYSSWVACCVSCLWDLEFFLLILVLFFVNASRFWLKSEQPNNLKF